MRSWREQPPNQDIKTSTGTSRLLRTSTENRKKDWELPPIMTLFWQSLKMARLLQTPIMEQPLHSPFLCL